MAQRESKTLSFTPQHADFVRECVESGQYQSTSEVVRAGLRLLQEQAKDREAGRARVQALIAEMASGVPDTVDPTDEQAQAERERGNQWLRAEIQKGLDDIDAGRTVTAEEMFELLRKQQEARRGAGGRQTA